MATYYPHSYLASQSSRVKSFSTVIFWIIFSISVLTIFFTPPENNIYDLLNIINIILIILYFILEFLVDYIIIPLADNKRQDDFIDNSCGTSFSLKNSIQYYDNDEIEIGTYKVSVNLFENCFFTYFLLKKTILQFVIIPFITLIFLIIISYYGFKNVPIALSILQIFLSTKILGNILKKFILLIKLNYIHDSLINLFQNDLKSNLVLYTPYIYRYWLQYESLHSKIPAGIPNKVFQKHNTNLTSEWKRIKDKYKIK